MGKTITKFENKEEIEEIKNVPYPLPEGWKWVRLEKVLKKEPQYGYTASATSKNTGIKFLRITDIQNNNVVWEKVPYVEIDNNTLLEKYKIAINDFVFARTGSTTGKTYRIRSLPEENYVIFASYLIRITPVLEKVEPRFLEYFFLSNEYWKQIITKGSSKPNFNAKKLKQILIPLPFKNGKPDLEKQKQIVEKIETIFKEIDKAITLRQKALEDTKKLFESVLNKIFKEAEEDKANWKWVILQKSLKTLESGKRPKGGAINKGIPSIGGEHLDNNGGFNFSNLKFIPEDFYKNMKKGKIQKTDILIVKDGATTGKVSYVNEDFPFKKAAVNEHVFILRIKEINYPKYVFWLLYSSLGQKEILKNFGGAAQGGINRKFVENVKIPIPFKNNQPNLEKQKQIAEYLDNLHNKIKQLEELQNLQIKKFKQLKESILNKAFRGELV